MLLSDLYSGTSCRVVKILLDGADADRLLALGLTRGTSVSVLARGMRGVIAVRVRGMRLAIGRRLAEGIEVAKQAYE